MSPLPIWRPCGTNQTVQKPKNPFFATSANCRNRTHFAATIRFWFSPFAIILKVKLSLVKPPNRKSLKPVKASRTDYDVLPVMTGWLNAREPLETFKKIYKDMTSFCTLRNWQHNKRESLSVVQKVLLQTASIFITRAVSILRQINSGRMYW